MQDGRSNINNDPLLVFGVEVQGRYLFLGCVDCGAEKKDTTFLTAVAEKCLQDIQWSANFGPQVVAYVVDGAPSVLNSALALQQKYDVISVRCQLHAIGLCVKHMFKRISFCQSAADRAEKVIDLFLTNGRLRSALKIHSKAAVPIRYVPVRMAIHVLAFKKLLNLRGALVDTVLGDHFKAYKDDKQTKPEKKARCREVKETILDNDFWMSLQFCVDAMSPLLIVLRIFDRSCTLAGFVHWLWGQLRDSICAALGKEDYVSIPIAVKQGILDVVEDTFLKECSFVFDAAYVLNPAFYDVICSLAASRDLCDVQEWGDLRQGTLDILTHVVRRDVGTRGLIEDFDTHMKKVTLEFQQFYTRKATFSDASSLGDDEDADIWWENTASGTLLKFYAIRVLNVAHAVSNVERNHKITSMIHTDKRNRLRRELVDTLTKAHLAQKNLRVSERRKEKFRPTMSDFKFISEISPDAEKDFDRWIEQVAGAVESTSISTSRTLDNPADSAAVETNGVSSMRLSITCDDPGSMLTSDDALEHRDVTGNIDTPSQAVTTNLNHDGVIDADTSPPAYATIVEEEPVEGFEEPIEPIRTRAGRQCKPPRWKSLGL